MRHLLTKGLLLTCCVLGAVSGYLIGERVIPFEPDSLAGTVGTGILVASGFLFVFVLRLRKEPRGPK